MEVPSVEYSELSGLAKGEQSSIIRERVVNCRQMQGCRFKDRPKVHSNAGMMSKDLERYCRLNEASSQALKSAMAELNFSARAYDRILKVARTIADLDGSEELQTVHVMEAVGLQVS